MGQFEGVMHLSTATESTTKIPWDNMWDDMPYKKTKFKCSTTYNRITQELIEEESNKLHGISEQAESWGALASKVVGTRD